MTKMLTARLVTLSLGASVLLYGFNNSDVTKPARVGVRVIFCNEGQPIRR
jgi:hypothetical protein